MPLYYDYKAIILDIFYFYSRIGKYTSRQDLRRKRNNQFKMHNLNLIFLIQSLYRFVPDRVH
jgi:hypothetical protein